MENFTYAVPTTIHFGKGQIEKLKELKESGDRVLLVYGGGSIKKMGLYDTVMQLLKDNGLTVLELSGVEPNPKIASVRQGVDICKKEKIDMVLAVGGGSVIDCAKVIASGAMYDGDPWDLVIHPEKNVKALPIYVVLTMSATGTEMDPYAVISDMSKNEKWGTAGFCLKPKMSILDPTYTFSVSKKQTIAGVADIMSHTFENYFTNVKGADMQARFAEGILTTLIKYAPIAVENPEDYDARANIMWCSSWAINGTLSEGADVAWCVHPMEHELSAFYDITHGEGLAILTPHWMRFALREETAAKFAEYGRNVWKLSGADDMRIASEAIDKTAEFFKMLGLPSTLREVGIEDEKHFDVMAKKAADGSVGSYVPLTKEDIVSIFKKAL